MASESTVMDLGSRVFELFANINKFCSQIVFVLEDK
jgi:hypothetical protein